MFSDALTIEKLIFLRLFFEFRLILLRKDFFQIKVEKVLVFMFLYIIEISGKKQDLENQSK